MAVAVFDLDGTIFFDRKISASTCQAINSWRERGHTALVATGKSPNGVREAIEPWPVRFDYYLACNGGVIMDADFEVASLHEIDVESVAKIYDFAAQMDGIAMFVCTADSLDLLLRDTTVGAYSAAIDSTEAVGLERLYHHQVMQVPLWVPNNEEKLEQVLEFLHTLPELEPLRNQDFIDVVPRGINKGTGVREVLTLLRAGAQPLYTFGDSWNDLAMHFMATKSFGFQWSPDEVKRAVDEVLTCVDSALDSLE